MPHILKLLPEHRYRQSQSLHYTGKQRSSYISALNDAQAKKEEELSEKASEYMNKADNAAIVFYTFIYLALFMCLLHAIFTLKGNNLSKKDFLIKLVKRMVVPVIIIILWILICDI